MPGGDHPKCVVIGEMSLVNREKPRKFQNGRQKIQMFIIISTSELFRSATVEKEKNHCYGSH